MTLPALISLLFPFSFHRLQRDLPGSRSFIHSYIHSVTPFAAYIPTFIYSFIHSFTHSLSSFFACLHSLHNLLQPVPDKMSLILIALLHLSLLYRNVVSTCSTTSDVEFTFYGFPDGPSDTTSFGCSGTTQVADGTAGGPSDCFSPQLSLHRKIYPFSIIPFFFEHRH